MTKEVKKFLINQHSTIKQAMKQLCHAGEKELFVVDEDIRLVGALSDGDIRKWILKGGGLEDSVDKIYNGNPKFVAGDYEIEDVQKMMVDLKIESIPVVNQDKKVEEVFTWDEVLGGKIRKHREALDIPVVIMAGGKGTRLDPYTRILPKALIPVGEKPIVEVIMDKLNEYSVSDFLISINHKSRMIKSYFEEMHDKYKIGYIEEKQALGTAGSLKLLGRKVKDETLVTNCDVIIDTDYAELVKFHREREYDLTLVATCHHYQVPYGVCEIENGGSLKNLQEKPEYDLLVNAGMYVINKKIFGLIPKNQVFNFTDLIAKAREENYKVGVFPINEKDWIDVGQWEEYRKSIKKLESVLE
ncbi:MAG: NTP transferase domain-containing protein [Candidatus Omnitrophica bacterium]|nr:NTP transferase domain-containing protein [Candidatus Omnitrophota bacterium]